MRGVSPPWDGIGLFVVPNGLLLATGVCASPGGGIELYVVRNGLLFAAGG